MVSGSIMEAEVAAYLHSVTLQWESGGNEGAGTVEGRFQVVHHRNHQRARCEQPLILDGKPMDDVTDYKYLGCWINEHGLWSQKQPSPCILHGRLI